MASPKKCSAGKVLRRSHRRSGKLVKAMCVKKAGKRSSSKRSARKRSAGKRSAGKRSSSKRSARKHSARKHSAHGCSPRKLWRKSHMRSGKRVAGKCVKKSARKM